jgi:hypothetical protein
MRLDEPIVSNGRVMMQGGKTLTGPEISVLDRRYPGLTVRVAIPFLDEHVSFEDDSRERQIAQEAQQRVALVMSQIHDRFSKRDALYDGDFDAIQTAVTDAMHFLRENPTSIAMVSGCLDPAYYLSTHVGNVFFLSILMGAVLQDYVIAERNRQTSARELDLDFAQDLYALGLGTLAMDLGMLRLHHLYEKDSPLTESDRAAILAHPLEGADMLPQSFSATAKMVVRTHHENFDGSGYPVNLAGDKLHVFTRIVRAADAYDAATSNRVFRAAKSPARILWDMSLGPHRRFFDPKVVDTLCRIIQPFPIGSKLRLEDGRFAVVTKYNRKTPLFPTVAIAFDRNDRPLPPAKIEDGVDLSVCPDVRLKAHRNEDISFIYEVKCDADPKIGKEFSSLLESAYP